MFRSTLFLVSCLVLLFGCETTDNNSSVVIDRDVRLVYRDADDNNLLNPDLANAITESNTDLYYVIDGEKQKVFDGNLDCPKMFCIEEGNDTISYKYFMKLFANTVRGQETATTYIQFSNGSMDTLKVGYEYSGNSVHLTKVWYNQELRFDPEKDGEENPLRYIEITKNFTE